jgi:glutathione synthase/RimK-type ligase-like ATP-grasp enzyme
MITAFRADKLVQERAPQIASSKAFTFLFRAFRKDVSFHNRKPRHGARCAPATGFHMILTATPFLWEQMFQAPLHQRIGPAPDVLADAIGPSAAPAMPAEHVLTDLQAALTALPQELCQRLEPRLLGMFFLSGLVAPMQLELIAAQDGEPVGAVLLLDAASLPAASLPAASEGRADTLCCAMLQAFDGAQQGWLADAPSPFPRRASRSAATQACLDMVSQPGAPFLGLAPFARLSAASGDMHAVAQALLELADGEAHNPGLWMNLSTVFFALGEKQLGHAMQQQALALQRTYALPAAKQPASLRVLLLMAQGDLAENTPLDCLLEGSDIDLILHYANAATPLPQALPEHDILMVGISHTVDNQSLLRQLEPLLADWDKPVLNQPRHIANTERSIASALLGNASGIAMPPTSEVTRDALQALLREPALVAGLFEGCAFPLILRPVGSHAGRDLARIASLEELSGYLAQVPDAHFYVSRFIDYRGADGQFRKARIALIHGEAHVCHMAISSHWMIHYVNAGMYEDAAKRAEEAAFMQDFDAFAARHREALDAIWQRSGLDYVCIDCAETRDGELLIFEIDHAMVAHAMDPEHLFPYKQAQMSKVRQAFEAFLHSLHQQEQQAALA